jgi:hypothetical protein
MEAPGNNFEERPIRTAKKRSTRTAEKRPTQTAEKPPTRTGTPRSNLTGLPFHCHSFSVYCSSCPSCDPSSSRVKTVFRFLSHRSLWASNCVNRFTTKRFSDRHKPAIKCTRLRRQDQTTALCQPLPAIENQKTEAFLFVHIGNWPAPGSRMQLNVKLYATVLTYLVSSHHAHSTGVHYHFSALTNHDSAKNMDLWLRLWYISKRAVLAMRHFSQPREETNPVGTGKHSISPASSPRTATNILPSATHQHLSIMP